MSKREIAHWSYNVIVVSYGGGTNSKAAIIGMVENGEKPDLILFADTVAERPETYADIEATSDWCVKNGLPEIITVKARASRMGGIEQYCLHHKQLPGIAYGFKSCSVQFKIEPVDEYLKANHKNEWDDCSIIKIVGIDADEAHRAKGSPNKHYENRFPLLEWDWGRDECVEAISRAGLTQPGKSACFFCPSTKPHEIRAMAETHPELIKRALKIEANADLTSIKGLGRSFAWKDLLATDDMFADHYHNIDQVCGCYDG